MVLIVGYVKRICPKCLFYQNEDMGMDGTRTTCEWKAAPNDMWSGQELQWVSANDYDKYPEMKLAHDMPCDGFYPKPNIKELRKQARKEIAEKQK